MQDGKFVTATAVPRTVWTLGLVSMLMDLSSDTYYVRPAAALVVGDSPRLRSTRETGWVSEPCRYSGKASRVGTTRPITFILRLNYKSC